MRRTKTLILPLTKTWLGGEKCIDIQPPASDDTGSFHHIYSRTGEHLYIPGMAPAKRNSALQKKIATLNLRLAPLVPLPSGPPHPGFPKTLMAYHLLTEDELDSIAHYYHQSTPGVWTMHYPATMNWDKEFLAKPTKESKDKSMSRRLSQQQEAWLDNLINSVAQVKEPHPQTSPSNGSAKYTRLTDAQRIAMKRRKVGKFIGLVGMETPVDEIEGRLRASLERAIERSREELQRSEEAVMRRKKMT